MIFFQTYGSVAKPAQENGFENQKFRKKYIQNMHWFEM